MAAMSAEPFSYFVYDRLVGVGGIDLTTTGDQTVNSTALTRYTGSNAFDNEVWLEVSTTTATTAPVVSLASYTSSDGTTGLTGDPITFPAVSTNSATIIPLPLNGSERGVRSVETVNVATAGTAGVASLLIVRRLVTIHPPLLSVESSLNSMPRKVNFLDDILMLPRIYDKACLALAAFAPGSSGGAQSGVIEVVYG